MKDYFHNVDLPDNEDDPTDPGIISKAAFPLQQFAYFVGVPVGVLALRNAMAKQQGKMVKKAEDEYRKIHAERERKRNPQRNPLILEGEEFFKRTEASPGGYTVEGDPKLAQLLRNIRDEGQLSNLSLEEVMAGAHDELKNLMEKYSNDPGKQKAVIEEYVISKMSPFDKTLAEAAGGIEHTPMKLASMITPDQMSREERNAMQMLDEYSKHAHSNYELVTNENGPVARRLPSRQIGIKITAFEVRDRTTGATHEIHIPVPIGGSFDMYNANIEVTTRVGSIPRVPGAKRIPRNINVISSDSNGVMGFQGAALRSGESGQHISIASGYATYELYLLNELKNIGRGRQTIEELAKRTKNGGALLRASSTLLGEYEGSSVATYSSLTRRMMRQMVEGGSGDVKSYRDKDGEKKYIDAGQEEARLEDARVMRASFNAKKAASEHVLRGLLIGNDTWDKIFQTDILPAKLRNPNVPEDLRKMLQETGFDNYMQRREALLAYWTEYANKGAQSSPAAQMAADIMFAWSDHYKLFHKMDDILTSKLGHLNEVPKIPTGLSGTKDQFNWSFKMSPDDIQGHSGSRKLADPRAFNVASITPWSNQMATKYARHVKEMMQTGVNFGFSFKTIDANNLLLDRIKNKWGVKPKEGGVSPSFNEIVYSRYKRITDRLDARQSRYDSAQLARKIYSKTIQSAGGNRTFEFTFAAPRNKENPTADVFKKVSLVFEGPQLAYSDAFYSRIHNRMAAIRMQFERDYNEHGMATASSLALKRYKNLFNGFKAMQDGAKSKAGKVMTKVKGFDDFVKTFGEFIDTVSPDEIGKYTRISTNANYVRDRNAGIRSIAYPSYRIDNKKSVIEADFGSKTHRLRFLQLTGDPADELNSVLRSLDDIQRQRIANGLQQTVSNVQHNVITIISSRGAQWGAIEDGALRILAKDGYEDGITGVVTTTSSGKFHLRKFINKETGKWDIELAIEGIGESKIIKTGDRARSFLEKLITETESVQAQISNRTNKEVSRSYISRTFKEHNLDAGVEVYARKGSNGWEFNSFAQSLLSWKAHIRSQPIGDNDVDPPIRTLEFDAIKSVPAGDYKQAKHEGMTEKAATSIREHDVAMRDPYLKRIATAAGLSDGRRGFIIADTASKGTAGYRTMGVITHIYNQTMRVTVNALKERYEEFRKKNPRLQAWSLRNLKNEDFLTRFKLVDFHGKRITNLLNLQKYVLEYTFLSTLTPYQISKDATGSHEYNEQALRGLREIQKGTSSFPELLKTNQGLADAVKRAKDLANEFYTAEPVVVSKTGEYSFIVNLKRGIPNGGFIDDVIGPAPVMWQIGEDNRLSFIKKKIDKDDNDPFDLYKPGRLDDRLDSLVKKAIDKDGRASVYHPLVEASELVSDLLNKFRYGSQSAGAPRIAVELIRDIGDHDLKIEAKRDISALSGLFSPIQIIENKHVSTAISGTDAVAKFFPRGGSGVLPSNIHFNMRDLLLLKQRNPAAANMVQEHMASGKLWLEKEIDFQLRFLDSAKSMSDSIKSAAGNIKVKRNAIRSMLLHPYRTDRKRSSFDPKRNPFLTDPVAQAGGDANRALAIVGEIQKNKFLDFKDLIDATIAEARGNIRGPHSLSSMNITEAAAKLFDSSKEIGVEQFNILRKNLEDVIRHSGKGPATLKILLSGFEGLEAIVDQLSGLGNRNILEAPLEFNHHDIEDVVRKATLENVDGKKIASARIAKITKGSSTDVAMRFMQMVSALDYIAESKRAYKGDGATLSALEKLNTDIIHGFANDLNGIAEYIKTHGAGKGTQIENRGYKQLIPGTYSMFRSDAIQAKVGTNGSIPISAEQAAGYITMNQEEAIRFMLGVDHGGRKAYKYAAKVNKMIKLVNEAVRISTNISEGQGVHTVSPIWDEVKELGHLQTFIDYLEKTDITRIKDHKQLKDFHNALRFLKRSSVSKRETGLIDFIKSLQDPESANSLKAKLYDESVRRVRGIMKGNINIALTSFRQSIYSPTDFRQLFLRIDNSLHNGQIFGSSIDIALADGDQDSDLMYHIGRGSRDLYISTIEDKAVKLAHARNELQIRASGLLQERLLYQPSNESTFRSYNVATQRWLRKSADIGKNAYYQMTALKDVIDSHVKDTLHLYNIKATPQEIEDLTKTYTKSILNPRMEGRAGANVDELFFISHGLADHDSRKIVLHLSQNSGKLTATMHHPGAGGSGGVFAQIAADDGAIKAAFISDAREKLASKYKKTSEGLKSRLENFFQELGDESGPISDLRGRISPETSSIVKDAAGVPYKYTTFANLTLEVAERNWFTGVKHAASREAFKEDMKKRYGTSNIPSSFNTEVIDTLRERFIRPAAEQLAMQSKHGSANIIRSFVERMQEAAKNVKLVDPTNPFSEITPDSLDKFKNTVRQISNFRAFEVDLGAWEKNVMARTGKDLGRMRYSGYLDIVKKRMLSSDLAIKSLMASQNGEIPTLEAMKNVNIQAMKGPAVGDLQARINAVVEKHGGSQSEALEKFFHSAYERFGSDKYYRNLSRSAKAGNLSRAILTQMASDMEDYSKMGATNAGAHTLMAHYALSMELRAGHVRMMRDFDLSKGMVELQLRITGAAEADRGFRVMKRSAEMGYEYLRGNGELDLHGYVKWINENHAGAPRRAAISGAAWFLNKRADDVSELFKLINEHESHNYWDSISHAEGGLNLNKSYHSTALEMKNMGKSALVGTFLAMGINQLLSGYAVPDLDRTQGKGGEYWEKKARKQSEMNMKPRAPMVEAADPNRAVDVATAMQYAQQNRTFIQQKDHARNQNFKQKSSYGVRIQ